MWPATPRRGKWGLAGEARSRTRILRLSYACYILECLSLKIQFVVLRVRGGLSWSGLVFMVVTRSSLVHCCWRLSFKMPLVWKSAYNLETLALEPKKKKMDLRVHGPFWRYPHQDNLGLANVKIKLTELWWDPIKRASRLSGIAQADYQGPWTSCGWIIAIKAHYI